MNKRLLQTLSCVALVLALSLSVAFAQDQLGLVAKIPFSFHIGQSILPAGEYVVRPVSTYPGRYIKISSADSAHIIMLMTVHMSHNGKNKDASLVFSQYGSTYFLAQVLSPANGISEQLHKGKLEKEFAANSSDASTVRVALTPR